MFSMTEEGKIEISSVRKRRAALAVRPRIDAQHIAHKDRPDERHGFDRDRHHATLGPLAIGAAVTDPSGAEIGRVTRITTDKAGRSVVEVRNDEDLFSIPAEALFTRGGKAYSVQTLDALKHSAAAH